MHERDRLEPAADRDRRAVAHDVPGCGGDGHEAGGARRSIVMPGTVSGKAGAQRGESRDVLAGRALLHRAPIDHVVDLGGVHARAAHGAAAIAWPPRVVRIGVVEGAAIGLADRGARGGDDDGFTWTYRPLGLILKAAIERFAPGMSKPSACGTPTAVQAWLSLSNCTDGPGDRPWTMPASSRTSSSLPTASSRP